MPCPLPRRRALTIPVNGDDFRRVTVFSAKTSCRRPLSLRLFAETRQVFGRSAAAVHRCYRYSFLVADAVTAAVRRRRRRCHH